MATGKHLGSRLSTISSQQLKASALKVNQGEPPLELSDMDKESKIPITENTGIAVTADTTTSFSEQPSSRPRGSEPIVEQAEPPIRTGEWQSIAGSIDKVSNRDWQTMDTFVKNVRQYKGRLSHDAAKLTPENHEFLKGIKYTMGVDISQFVNNFIEQFRGRFKEELPAAPKR